jgi:hypothetical protein
MKTNESIGNISAEKLNRALRRCHERQFAGEDWQAVAIDAWNEFGSPDGDEVFNFLTSTPDHGCDCGFCAHAAWQDY